MSSKKAGRVRFAKANGPRESVLYYFENETEDDSPLHRELEKTKSPGLQKRINETLLNYLIAPAKMRKTKRVKVLRGYGDPAVEGMDELRINFNNQVIRVYLVEYPEEVVVFQIVKKKGKASTSVAAERRRDWEQRFPPE